MNDVGSKLRDASRLVAPPERAFERLQHRRDRRARNRRVASMGVGLGLTVAVAGGLLIALSELGSSDRVRFGGSGLPDGRLVLEEGEYFYERTLIVIPEGIEGMQSGTAEIETWWGFDGSGRELGSSDTSSFSPRESDTWDSGQGPLDLGLAELSTDPETLEEQLSERSTPGGASPQPKVTPGVGMSQESGQLWRAIEALLEMPNAIPELRVALFRVASGIEGVEVRQDVRDFVGRPAVALRITTPQAGATDLFFDPETLQPMGGDLGHGQRIVVEAGIVGSRAETPDPGERFFPPPTDQG
jgi:hypothetical protein